MALRAKPIVCLWNRARKVKSDLLSPGFSLFASKHELQVPYIRVTASQKTYANVRTVRTDPTPALLGTAAAAVQVLTSTLIFVLLTISS